MIERIHLNILREVERQGTVTAAANHLCLSQSALSHAMKKLEQQLGVRLWEKQGRVLRLTQAGQYLLSVANRILPQLEHTERMMQAYAAGSQGGLRIGMECHPCYQWLLKVVPPFLTAWPGVDLDVRNKFQFGGIAALFNYDIDALVTPDPLSKTGIVFFPVFAYELVLAVPQTHVFAELEWISPEQLSEQILITYPVELDRLDIYSQFLIPAQCSPMKRKLVETSEIMLHMVAAGRGVTALPAWLLAQDRQNLDIKSVRLGKEGIHKHIHIGIRASDAEIDYIAAFVAMAKSTTMG